MHICKETDQLRKKWEKLELDWKDANAGCTCGTCIGIIKNKKRKIRNQINKVKKKLIGLVFLEGEVDPKSIKKATQIPKYKKKKL